MGSASSADLDIYELTASKDMSQLRSLLSGNPRAWDTGDDYFGDSPAGIAVTTPNLSALKLFAKNGLDLNPAKFFDHPIRLINPNTGRDSPEHIEVLAWILSEIEIRPDLGYTLSLLDFVKHENSEASTLLLDAGVDPNRWIHQWYSVLDLTDDCKMRELLESYGAKSNFRKLVMYGIVALFLVFVLLHFIFKAKSQKTDHSDALTPERNDRKGRIYVGVGVLLFVLGSLAMLLFRYGSVIGFSVGDMPIFLYGILIVLAGLGIRFTTHGKKLKTKDAHQILQEDKRPIFLYLRSFTLDEEDARQEISLPGGLSVPINPWESGLSVAFGKVGDLVGIGKPGEKLATVGAARVYVTDDEWQDKVLELVQKSDIVIWTYGATEGLRWEIQRLVNNVPPEKLVLAMPFWDKKMSKRKIIWAEARENMSAIFPKALPEAVGNSLFVSFEKDWTPIWVNTQPPPWSIRVLTLGFWNPLASGVRGLLKQRGYNYPSLTLPEKMMPAMLALMGWTVLGVILVMIYGLYVAFF